MASNKKSYLLLMLLKHDGKTFAVGDEIHLDEKTSTELLSLGVILEKKTEPPKGKKDE